MKSPILLAIVSLAALNIGADAAEKSAQPEKPAKQITYAGGDGTSIAKAVIIRGATKETRIRAEYKWMANHHPNFKKRGEKLMTVKGRRYDLIEFTGKSGKESELYFDITEFSRKP